MLTFFKSLHIIGFVSWFAGLFYLGRLLIYLQEAQSKPASERNVLSSQFNIMTKRVQFAIIYPALIITLIAGLVLTMLSNAYLMPWFHLKSVFLLVLIIYTIKSNAIRVAFLNQSFGSWSSLSLRYWNEVPTLLLVWIVFLAGFKRLFFSLPIIFGLVAFSVLIMWSVSRLNKR